MRRSTSLIFCLFLTAAQANADSYPWLQNQNANYQTVEQRISPPSGFIREKALAGSYAEWLRNLPLKPKGSPVLLFNGKKKFNQLVHTAVIDIDTGNRDLQQCADATMRLRAEYLYASGKSDAIKFNYTSGDPAKYSQWSKGYRPRISGNKVTWNKTASADKSYSSFRNYLTSVFTYAGSYSLDKELKPRPISEMKIGDVFIQGGFPGHAVIVIDMAVNPKTGNKVFLVAQSYMPAQQIHILKNLAGPTISPWYPLDFGETLITPEWVFKKGDLHRFE